MMPITRNYICVPCGTFMRCEQNGVTIEELMDDGSPYKLWDADKYRCPSCGYKVISGFGRMPMAEYYQPNYIEVREQMAPVVTAKMTPYTTLPAEDRGRSRMITRTMIVEERNESITEVTFELRQRNDRAKHDDRMTLVIQGADPLPAWKTGDVLTVEIS